MAVLQVGLQLILAYHTQVNHAMTPFLLSDLEKDAKRLADEISLMTGSLRSNLHAVRGHPCSCIPHTDAIR
jgi:hypothetical protein